MKCIESRVEGSNRETIQNPRWEFKRKLWATLRMEFFLAIGGMVATKEDPTGVFPREAVEPGPGVLE
jgi:hypothetical protein